MLRRTGFSTYLLLEISQQSLHLQQRCYISGFLTQLILDTFQALALRFQCALG
ncbi:hypothetical protein G9444_4246 [Rhodococcus erythropolis]|uniref:Uncharacterized protein n=1 Tax=Rhodococcus erythropolis TaxID=1833 RepID=A0A6G9CXE9_RHOER|nr:hypothetical protein G9444_4246 [Rhodococcus erythropolis]